MQSQKETLRPTEPSNGATPVRQRPLPTTTPSTAQRASRIPGVDLVHSKYRHVDTKLFFKDKHFFNLRRVNTRIPTESNGFCVSAKWAAVPLAGPGGVLAILKASTLPEQQ